MCGACLLLLLGKNRAPSSILSRKKNVVSIRHENTLLQIASGLNGYSNSTVMAICPCINSRLTTANPNSSKNLVFHHLFCIVVDNIVKSIKSGAKVHIFIKIYKNQSQNLSPPYNDKKKRELAALEVCQSPLLVSGFKFQSGIGPCPHARGRCDGRQEGCEGGYNNLTATSIIRFVFIVIIIYYNPPSLLTK